MNIIIIGPQASGKGTQSELISKKFNIPHISTGDLFRNEIKTNSPDGKYIQSFTNNGILVPDEFTIKLLKKRLKNNDCKNGFILDGFPRNINQAEQLDKIINIDKAILIDIDRQEIMERLLGRLVCEECGFSTHKKWVGESRTCKCGGNLITRADDNVESIKVRLEAYDKQTIPVLDYYAKQNKLAKVDGLGNIDEVFNHVQSVLGG